MKDSLTWFIFGAGYIPMHFMVPLLLAFMTGDETDDERKALLRYVGIEGGVSLLMVGGAALLFLESNPMYSLTILLVGPLIPLVGLWFYRKRHGTRWTKPADDREG